MVTRRTTPQHVTKSTHGFGRSSNRDRERDEDALRDGGESFPQYCMSCEKQFQAANNTFLYCSEACRIHDTQLSYSQPATPSSPPLTPYTRPYSSLPGETNEGPDILPRFSPTQSRPRSYFNSDPYPSTYHQTYSYSPPHHQTHPSTSALASLRELAIALPRNRDPESPPSSISRTGSGVWNYMPFTSSGKPVHDIPSITPGNSYNGSGYVSQSYGAPVKSREDLYAYGRSHGTYGNTGGMGMDRPLPPRRPGGYGARPTSIDLVTPVHGGMI